MEYVVEVVKKHWMAMEPRWWVLVLLAPGEVLEERHWIMGSF
jgi:hypothetical protein